MTYHSHQVRGYLEQLQNNSISLLPYKALRDMDRYPDVYCSGSPMGCP